MKNINTLHILAQINVIDLHTTFKKLKIFVALRKASINKMDDAIWNEINTFHKQEIRAGT
jgi:hypothetical protein